MFCSKCGKQISSDGAFCSWCSGEVDPCANKSVGMDGMSSLPCRLELKEGGWIEFKDGRLTGTYKLDPSKDAVNVDINIGDILLIRRDNSTVVGNSVYRACTLLYLSACIAGLLWWYLGIVVSNIFFFIAAIFSIGLLGLGSADLSFLLVGTLGAVRIPICDDDAKSYARKIQEFESLLMKRKVKGQISQDIIISRYDFSKEIRALFVCKECGNIISSSEHLRGMAGLVLAWIVYCVSYALGWFDDGLFDHGFLTFTLVYGLVLAFLRWVIFNPITCDRCGSKKLFVNLHTATGIEVLNGFQWVDAGALDNKGKNEYIKSRRA